MMWRYPGALIAGLFLSCAACSAPADRNDKAEAFSGRVIHVHDGDSIWVRPDGQDRKKKLRLEAIDAPEICQEGGVAARDALRGRIDGRMVTVRQNGIDVYGRPLVEVLIGGEDVGAWMVEQGWAWSYRSKGSAGRFPTEEAKARKLGRGIFANSQAESPGLFRRRHGPCPRE